MPLLLLGTPHALFQAARQGAFPYRRAASVLARTAANSDVGFQPGQSSLFARS